ncbi:MAG: hypothetical protein IJA69_03200, partial [Clostridia bacterium]|nr:hypothetical protein [Clostridia bacterium]
DKLAVNIWADYEAENNQNSNAKIEVSEQVSVLNTTDKKTQDYVVTFSIGNKELDAGITDFSVNIYLEKGDGTIADINEVKVGNTAVATYANTQVKANAENPEGSTTLSNFASTQSVDIAAGSEVVIATKLTSKTANYAKVNLSYNDVSSTNAALCIRGTSLILDIRESAGQTYYIYLKNTGTTNITDLSLSSLGLTLTFDNSYESLLQQGTRNEGGTNKTYYYVEMGTLPTATANEYIKWRYISEDGKTKFTNEEQPFSLKGTYILETDVQHLTNSSTSNADSINKNKILRNDGVANNMLLSVSYQNNYTANWDNGTGYLTGDNSTIKANDYALSTVRQYINGTNVRKAANTDDLEWSGTETVPVNESSQNSNMLTDLCINAEEDVVYNKIVARSLNDLYSDMGEGLGDDTNYLTDTAYALGAGKVSNTDTLTEKFWLPSFAEVKDLLASSDSYELYQEDAGADWNTSNTDGYYWLRSPYADYSVSAYYVSYNGDCHYNFVDDYYCAALAAFTLA